MPRVDGVSDLRAACIQNNTGSLLPVTKTIPDITHTAAPLRVIPRADKTAELPTLIQGNNQDLPSGTVQRVRVRANLFRKVDKTD